MIFLDYSREEGEWEPNIYGERENLAAVSFLKELNEEVYASFSDVQTIAEESTAFPMVSHPTFLGGLGFGMKWMMGWMNDTLTYFKKEPIYRRHHQNDLTFSMAYAFTENFMLPLSHDEVVYGKGSILRKMPGDEWQKFANARLLYSYMFTHPGTNLLFMGSEFGQHTEWNFRGALDWYILEYDFHSGLKELVKDLNILYKQYPALYEKQFESEGYECLSFEDHENSVINFLRKGNDETDTLVVVSNLTPVVRNGYRIGVPKGKKLIQVFNSDYKKYGGSGITNKKKLKIDKQHWNYRDYSSEINIPPLGTVIFKIE